MKIEFKDKLLALIRSDRAAETKLPFVVIKSCREKFVFIEAAPDGQTLRSWKSLHYEKLKGDLADLRSIRINEKWRIVFSLDETEIPPIFVVYRIEDYH